jgi:hypothetical protein
MSKTKPLRSFLSFTRSVLRTVERVVKSVCHPDVSDTKCALVIGGLVAIVLILTIAFVSVFRITANTGHEVLAPGPSTTIT